MSRLKRTFLGLAFAISATLLVLAGISAVPSCGRRRQPNTQGNVGLSRSASEPSPRLGQVISHRYTRSREASLTSKQ